MRKIQYQDYVISNYTKKDIASMTVFVDSSSFSFYTVNNKILQNMSFYFQGNLVGFFKSYMEKNHVMVKYYFVKEFIDVFHKRSFLKLAIHYVFKELKKSKIHLLLNQYEDRKWIEELNFKYVGSNISLNYHEFDLYPTDFYFIFKYNTLLLDADDTILDFQKAEYHSLKKSLLHFGIEPTEEMIALYHQINIQHWEMVEKKLISKQECLIYRFVEFFQQINVELDPNEFENEYRCHLNTSYYVIKNAHKVLEHLRNHFDLYLITNGVKDTQLNRLSHSKMNQYFKQIFISEDLHVAKPSPEFITHVSKAIPNFKKDETLIIGDSLTSDMKLGENCHIDTCWCNFSKKENTSTIKPTYTILDLMELYL